MFRVIPFVVALAALAGWPNSGRYPAGGTGPPPVTCSSTVANPSNLGASPWTTFAAVAITYPSGVLSPDGTDDASHVSIVSSGFAQVYQSGVLGSVMPATISAYVKAVTPGTNNKFRFELKGPGGDTTSSDITANASWVLYSFTSSAQAFTGFGIYIDTAGDNAELYVWCVSAP